MKRASQEEAEATDITSGEYAKFTSDSAFYQEHHSNNYYELNYLVLGVGGEGGEVVDAWKKFCREAPIHALTLQIPMESSEWKAYGLPIVYELGDVMWYVTHLLRVLDISMEDLLLLNAYKLYQRHKDKDIQMEWCFEMPLAEAARRVEELESYIRLRGPKS